MKESNFKANALISFFTLTFLLSVPFYLLNALAYLDLAGSPEMGALYIAILTLTPIASASILTSRRHGRQGLKELFRRIFDLKRIKKRRWFLVILLLPPLLFLLSSFLIYLLGFGLPASITPITALPALIPFFFLLAAGEELGWMGYAFEPMQSSLGALRAALVLGIIWALWHLPFFVFMMPDTLVLIADLLTLVATRVLLAWIFNNTGKSVFAAILFHASGNVGLMIFPEIKNIIPWGSAIYCGLVLIAALFVTLVWGSGSLSDYRFTNG